MAIWISMGNVDTYDSRTAAFCPHRYRSPQRLRARIARGRPSTSSPGATSDDNLYRGRAPCATAGARPQLASACRLNRCPQSHDRTGPVAVAGGPPFAIGTAPPHAAADTHHRRRNGPGEAGRSRSGRIGRGPEFPPAGFESGRLQLPANAGTAAVRSSSPHRATRTRAPIAGASWTTDDLYRETPAAIRSTASEVGRAPRRLRRLRIAATTFPCGL